MNIALTALLAWMPFVLILFTALRPRHAVLVAYVGGWLFLPMYAIKLPILPDLTKVTATSMPVLLCVFLFDFVRATSLRPRWFDVPMIAWCIAPFFSSMQNGLGAWDGASASIQHIVLWGIPYFVGRLYFADWDGIRELALSIFIGGLVYVPFCWWEIRFSPQLHKQIYGFIQHSFSQAVRGDGYRPMVFMQHGLALGMWMAMASLVGMWLWMTKTVRHLASIPMLWLVPLLVLTSVWCRSTGATLCFLAGFATLFWIKHVKTVWPLVLLVLLVPGYMMLRATNTLTSDQLTSLAANVFPENRVQSLETRLRAEDMLVQRALQSPAFGWGKWNPADPSRPKWRIFDEKGKDLAITDGMWVIILGTCGLIGLISLTMMILAPSLLYMRRVPPGWWAHPMAAPGAVLAVLIALHMIDNLLNAMVNPIFVLAIGGLGALGTQRAAQPASQQRQYPYNPYPARRPSPQA